MTAKPRGKPAAIAACLWPLLLANLLVVAAAVSAQASDPIRIGMGAQLSGALAASGKANLLAQEIWAKEINARGGLLGRPVELVHYDNQSNPALMPGIYAKLIDVDKVDLLMGEGTNLMAAAMPVVIQHNRTIITLLALAVNQRFHYPRYFQTAPWGPNGNAELSRGFFAIAKTINPPPKTVALVGADAEFSSNVLKAAQANAKEAGLEIVYYNTYPPNTVDYSPIVRAIQAAQPDVVFVASYPVDSVGMVRAARELGLKAEVFGGAMVGLQYASTKMQLVERLDRIVNYDLYVPEPTLKFPGIEEFVRKYQARAKEEGVDQLGYYQPPYTYAAMQIVEQAVTGAGSLDDGKLADYLHGHTFKTIVGEVSFDRDGEWASPRVLDVQFQNIDGSGLEQYKRPGTQVILYPFDYKSGSLQYPFAK